MKTESSTRDRFLIPEDALERMATREAEERRNAVESEQKAAQSNRRRNANTNDKRPSEYKWIKD